MSRSFFGHVTLEVPIYHGRGTKWEYVETVERQYTVGSAPRSRSKKITHILVWDEVETFGDLATFLATIARMGEGLEDPTVSIQTYDNYGDEQARLVVSGWRPIAAHELAAYKEQQRARDEERENWQRQELEQIRAAHPDWLREDLRDG